ncbi:hypothetical protein [Photorhabdus namnaonensis]|uniref:Uncharacterized protein n=1 Tax=Photorhabdus namnaonensis TaxID=1851568 RepID=A0A1B8YDE4_9GAMM|nr:hypothetical protein [Photorhabdus namnaonensis]OCA53105.1 hypothetical protein Phpb_04157 [Photorhabdus namnaonensis]
MKKTLLLALFLLSLSSTAATKVFVCGNDFIQIVDNNGLIEEVRVNDKPTDIFTMSHKVTDAGDVDSFFIYGYKGNREVTRLFNSGKTKQTIKQNFLFSPNGSPENPGKPVGKSVLCR